jgi:hypothetical protein
MFIYYALATSYSVECWDVYELWIQSGVEGNGHGSLKSCPTIYVRGVSQ